METRTVQVRLQGVTLIINTTHTDEALDQIVRHAQDRLDEIASAGVGSNHEAALVALLCLAEEALEAKQRYRDLKEQIRAKSADILDMLGGPECLDKGDTPPGGGIGI